MSSLILPGSIEFHRTLSAMPPDWKEIADKHNTFTLIGDPETQLMRSATPQEFREYLLGGEYNEWLKNDGYEDDIITEEDISGVKEIYIDY